MWMLCVLLFPSVAWANAGAPLLLIVNFMAFVYGSVLIVAAETLIYKVLTKDSWKSALYAIFGVNLLSTIVIGLGIPLVIGLVTALLGFLLVLFWQDAADVAMFVLGTWIYDGSPYIGESYVTYIATGLWLFVLYILTVYFEAYLIRKLWRKRSFKSPVGALKLNIVTNSVTYAGLATFFIYFFIFN